MKKYVFLLAVFVVSCDAPDQETHNATPAYFDLKDYFIKEAEALNRQNPFIDKTVVVNGKAEQKHVKISNWTKELSAFMDADINKPAWSGEFSSTSNEDGVSYSSRNEQVPIKKIQINKRNGVVTGLEIMIHNSNYLYSSTDTLRYYPDSLYSIKKAQQIKLLSPKRYQITGKF